MPEVTTPAESSPVESADPFNGQQPSLREFSAYRVTGEVPERFKPVEEAESTPAAEVEETENAPASALEDDQELPEGIGNKARRRFEKLLAEKKELERKLAERAKPDEKPASSSAPTVQQIAQTRPEPTLNDKNQDGTLKYADYAAFVKDLGRWSAEQGYHELRQREIQQQQAQQVQKKVETDRERYGQEFDSIIEPTAGKIMSDASIPMEVKRMLAASDVLPELVYTIGTDPKTMEKLTRVAKSDPQQAMYYIAELSAGIRQELAADAEKPSKESTPEPKHTSAPKPPVPVSGPSSRAFDVSDTSLSPEDWARKRNAQLARRQRG
jgi:hypothetical protein